MVEAAVKFRETLEQAAFNQPRFGVLANFTGGFHDTDTASIKSRLFMQLFNPVLWHKNLTQVAATAPNLLIEFGGGLGKGKRRRKNAPTWKAS